MATENQISRKERDAVLLNAERFGREFEERIALQGMSAGEKLKFKAGKFIGRALRPFVVIPDATEVVVIENRSIDPSELGKTTYQTRAGFGPTPKPGVVTFTWPWEKPITIKTQDIEPIEMTIPPDQNGLDIPGIGALGLKIRAQGQLIPIESKYYGQPSEELSGIMRVLTASDNDPRSDLSSVIHAGVFTAWGNIRRDPRFIELRNRLAKNIQYSRQDLGQQTKNINLISENFAVITEAVREGVITFASERGWQLDRNMTTFDSLLSREFAEASNNIAQIQEAQVVATGIQLQTAARVGPIADAIERVTERLLTPLLQAFISKDQNND